MALATRYESNGASCDGKGKCPETISWEWTSIGGTASERMDEVIAHLRAAGWSMWEHKRSPRRYVYCPEHTAEKEAVGTMERLS